MKKKQTLQEKIHEKAAKHAGRKIISNHYEEYLDELEKSIKMFSDSQSHSKEKNNG